MLSRCIKVLVIGMESIKSGNVLWVMVSKDVRGGISGFRVLMEGKVVVEVEMRLAIRGSSFSSGQCALSTSGGRNVF